MSDDTTVSDWRTKVGFVREYPWHTSIICSSGRVHENLANAQLLPLDYANMVRQLASGHTLQFIMLSIQIGMGEAAGGGKGAAAQGAAEHGPDEGGAGVVSSSEPPKRGTVSVEDLQVSLTQIFCPASHLPSDSGIRPGN